MSTIYWLILGLALGGLAVLVARRFFAPPQEKEGNNEALGLLQNQLHELTRVLDTKLSDSSTKLHQSLQQQFGESSRLIREITQELVKVGEGQKQVVSFADQLRSLQDILKNPKQRGVLGEYYLETLLKNVLPVGSYQMQYPFRDGNIVDAAVFVREKIVPIDSKFSLENYNRLVEAKDPSEKDRLEKLFVSDLKNRILETSKYIRPEENTTDFAFMFIPHEAIYYDLLVNKIGAVTEDTENLIQRAAGKYRVIIVSPTSFLAYLQTVLQGLKALQIEESAKEIRARVEELGKHLGAYDQYMNKLGGALSTTVNHYNAAYKEFKKVDKDVLRIAGGNNGIEPLTIDRPSLDE